MHVISNYINTIFANYFIILFLACGIFLFIFEASFIDPKKFPIEEKIAKIGGLGYIILSIGMYILSLFIK